MNFLVVLRGKLENRLIAKDHRRERKFSSFYLTNACFNPSNNTESLFLSKSSGEGERINFKRSNPSAALLKQGKRLFAMC